MMRLQDSLIINVLGQRVLQSFAVFIAIIHAVFAAVYLKFSNSSDNDLLVLEVCFTIIITAAVLLLGVVTKCTFWISPFASSQYVLTIFVGFRAILHIQDACTQESPDRADIVIILCEVLCLALMLASSRVIFLVYEFMVVEINIPKVQSYNTDETEKIPKRKRYISNCVLQLAKNNKFTKLTNSECCEATEKSNV